MSATHLSSKRILAHFVECEFIVRSIRQIEHPWKSKHSMIIKANSSCPLRPRTTPFQKEKSILGVIYGVLLPYHAIK